MYICSAILQHRKEVPSFFLFPVHLGHYTTISIQQQVSSRHFFIFYSWFQLTNRPQKLPQFTRYTKSTCKFMILLLTMLVTISVTINFLGAIQAIYTCLRCLPTYKLEATMTNNSSTLLTYGSQKGHRGVIIAATAGRAELDHSSYYHVVHI